MDTPEVTEHPEATARAGVTSFRNGTETSRAMVAEVSRAWQLVARINAVAPGDFTAMQALLTELTGREVDASVRVVPPFYPDGGHALRLGRNVFVNHGCTAVVVGGIEIGDDVMIGPNVQLISGGHSLEPETRRTVSTCAPVVIGRGVWIGAGATILPGVTIGEDAVVAAGAVVTKDVAPPTLVGGVPATLMREL